MSQKKKQIREKFRTDVFERDNFCCQGCDLKGDSETLDAHHIIDRNELPNGGYVKENGITLCKERCHILAEKFHETDGKEWEDGFHPDDLFKLIDSSSELAYKKSKKL